MHQHLYINKDTMDEIENYLSLTEPPGIILQGIPGLGQELTARYIAAKLLKCQESDLEKNPDYYQTAQSALKVDDIEQLLEASRRNSIGDVKVFILFCAHTISRTAQNRLLKLLEDRASSNKLIIVSEKDSLLDTIKSRCYSVLFHPLREEAMEKYLKELKIDKDCIGFVGFLAENAPYSITASMEGINEYIDCYRRIRQITLRENLLQLLHVLKEKDDNEFFKNHEAHPVWNIRMLLYPFYQFLAESPRKVPSKGYPFPDTLYTRAQALEIMEYGLEHLSMAQRSYTKNDYFNLIRYIIQIK